MTETILIIALIVTIIFDVIRIVQYFNLRKSIHKYSRNDFAVHLDYLYIQWVNTERMIPFGQFAVEHWNDPQTEQSEN